MKDSKKTDYEHMIYICDGGHSDRVAVHMLKDNNGVVIGVYDPDEPQTNPNEPHGFLKARTQFAGFVDNDQILEADYRTEKYHGKNSKLIDLLISKIDSITRIVRR